MSYVDEILEQVITLLKRQGRVSYRAIKVRFDLNDDHLEAVKDELIYAQKLAVDEDNRVLVWTGEVGTKSESTSTQPVQTSEQPLTQQDQPIAVEPPPTEPL